MLPSLDNVAATNREFTDLVASVRLQALWFIAPDASLEITRPEADRVLRAIARAGDRTVWQRARKLQAWRLLHCN